MLFNNEKSPLYEIKKYENSRKDGNYSFRVKWNVESISGRKDASGFIVQLVMVEDTAGIIDNYNGPYYEAWEVKSGRTDSRLYDDKFELGNDGWFDEFVAEISKGKKGTIKYIAELFWIDIYSEMYSIVKKCKQYTVSMAQELPAVLKKDCSEFIAPKIDTRIFIVEIDN